jgi:hypothetical protein
MMASTSVFAPRLYSVFIFTMKPATEKVESLTERVSRSARTVKTDDIAAEIKKQIGDHALEAIYRDLVLVQRTRQYELRAPAKSARVEILHTLLGIELKIANRRLLCPDLATARYLSVFARIGCDVIAVPYDITQVSRIADELESSWHRTMLLIEHFTVDRSERLRTNVRVRILKDARTAVASLGAGAKVPQFNQNTRQRRK